MICATYILTLHGPDGADESVRIFQPNLRETEENLTDLLPLGYWVAIESFEALLDKEEEATDG
jgi:hypothetical protein